MAHALIEVTINRLRSIQITDRSFSAIIAVLRFIAKTQNGQD